MREASIQSFRASLRACIVTMLLTASCALAGCAGGGAPQNSFAMATSGPAIAFEQIDGPPPQVFDRMVSVLDSESKLRNLAIVSREGQTAAYRVRFYLAAQVVRGKTMIAWVWDVYDRDQQRALRLSGEEAAGKAPGRDAWAAADDMILRKIAQAGLSGLSNLSNGIPADQPLAPAAEPASRHSPAVASAEPSATEAADAGALGYAAH
ncbi:MAG: hypothetical protein JO052_13010 [Bradyrhizobium sp.]|nr:hypothetical protein [Bradyrhizobium sp.]